MDFTKFNFSFEARIWPNPNPSPKGQIWTNPSPNLGFGRKLN